jgi:hypothetical protein
LVRRIVGNGSELPNAVGRGRVRGRSTPVADSWWSVAWDLAEVPSKRAPSASTTEGIDMQLAPRPDRTSAGFHVLSSIDAYKALGAAHVEETSPTSVRVTIDPAKSSAEAANIAAVLDRHPVETRGPIDVEVLHGATAIDARQASREGVLQALRSLSNVTVDDTLGRFKLTTVDKNYAWARVHEEGFNRIMGSRVLLPPDTVAVPMPIELTVGRRIETSADHHHDAVVL